MIVILVSCLAVCTSLDVDLDGDADNTQVQSSGDKTSDDDLKGLETKYVMDDNSILLDTSTEVVGDVKTKLKVSNPTEDTKVSVNNQNIDRKTDEETKEAVIQTASITATLENVIDETTKDSITITDKSENEVETESNTHSSSSVKTLSHSKVVSASSLPSIESSISETPTLPSVSTTEVSSSLKVTTNALDESELDRWKEVENTNSMFKSYDFRAQFPQTVFEGINPTKTLERVERTVPSYPRKNPNMVGLMSPDVDEEIPDQFLSHQY